jgi:hypothetical protein
MSLFSRCIYNDEVCVLRSNDEYVISRDEYRIAGDAAGAKSYVTWYPFFVFVFFFCYLFNIIPS